ncbi:hypothetical protein L2E82_30629 [Cichorium intybus]|uniref:Uncharacterized protein n=1 Tax=Cichorium intybus TaxID=13427 RepID=A0ACB9D0W9_CICIN|nr:hypothetical protein L2E82_30629 [Cichorium intybus]
MKQKMKPYAWKSYRRIGEIEPTKLWRFAATPKILRIGASICVNPRRMGCQGLSTSSNLNGSSSIQPEETTAKGKIPENRSANNNGETNERMTVQELKAKLRRVGVPTEDSKDDLKCTWNKFFTEEVDEVVEDKNPTKVNDIQGEKVSKRKAKVKEHTEIPGSLNCYHGVIDTLKDISQHEDLKGLYRGLAPRLAIQRDDINFWIQRDDIRSIREYYKERKDVEGTFTQLSRFFIAEKAILQCLKIMMYVYSYQSYLWNHVASIKAQKYDSIQFQSNIEGLNSTMEFIQSQLLDLNSQIKKKKAMLKSLEDIDYTLKRYFRDCWVVLAMYKSGTELNRSFH